MEQEEQGLKEQVPSRCWYYLLEWNDKDDWATMQENFFTKKLRDLTTEQFWELFKIATDKDKIHKGK